MHLTYPFHDLTVTVTRCGRICFSETEDQRLAVQRGRRRRSAYVWYEPTMPSASGTRPN
jgi:hypothetical protein